jgi:hypothetical protein
LRRDDVLGDDFGSNEPSVSHTSLKEVEDKVGGIFCGSLRGDPRFEKIVASLAPKEDRH